MIIKDWEILYGVFLLILPHIVAKHYMYIIGTVFLSLAGMWLIGQGLQKIKAEIWNKPKCN